MANLQIANTILEQLGGKMFVAMTGAKNLTGGANFLSLKIGRGTKNKATHLRITLDPSDTYTVEFLKCGVKTGIKVLSKVSDLYAEDMQSHFTAETGFYTHL